MLKRFLVFLSALSMLIFSACAIPKPSEQELVYTFFDLDDAESAVLQCGKISALIDCGRSTSFFELSTELDRRGIETLDYFILTHPHDDHIGCAEEVLRHYRPKTVLLPDLPQNVTDFNAIKETAALLQLEVKTAKANNQIPFGAATIDVFAPNSLHYQEINNFSLVLKITLGNRSLLLCGDAEAESEYEMLSLGYPLSSDVLKVAHHGSITSSSDEFLSAINATYAIVSAKQDVSALTQYRLHNTDTTLFRSDRHGTITVQTDGTKLTISSEK